MTKLARIEMVEGCRVQVEDGKFLDAEGRRSLSEVLIRWIEMMCFVMAKVTWGLS